jgi:hypothetical protein
MEIVRIFRPIASAYVGGIREMTNARVRPAHAARVDTI